MQMVWHQYELMKKVGASSSVPSENLKHNFRDSCHTKQTAIFPSLCGHKVGATRRCPMSQSTHNFRG